MIPIKTALTAFMAGQRLFVGAIGSVAALSSLGAVAQTDPVALEEVLVTAQKRQQSAQDVPISMTVTSGLLVDELKIVNVNDIAALVPNLQVNQILGDATPVFALRGITMNDFSIHQSSPIAVYTDEVYAGSAIMQPMSMFDLERIEVLRGPQGTLYGRNSTGGAVNLITRAPGFEREGYLTAGVGNFNRRELRGAVQTGLHEDVLAFRLAGMLLEQDGFFENQFDGNADNNSFDEWAVRASLLWRPTDALELVARYSRAKATPTASGVFPGNIDAIGVGLGADLYDLYNALGADNPPDYLGAGVGDFELRSNYVANKRRENEQASLHFNWDLSSVLALTSVSAWSDADFFNPEDSDGAPMTVIHNDYRGSGDQLSQDLRLTSRFGGPFEFVSGVYYAKEQLDVATDLDLYADVDFNLSGALDPGDCLDPWNAAFGEPLSESGVLANDILLDVGFPNGMADLAALGCGYRNTFSQERRTLAAYFDGSYGLTEQLRLLFGARITRDQTKVRNYRTRVEGQGVYLFDTVPAADDSLRNTELTWRLGVERDLGTDAITYATYSRGYREGAFNGQGFFSPDEFNAVDPETLDAFELGLKSMLMDGRLRLNAAAFLYFYEGQQLFDVNTLSGATTLINLDESRVRGVELEVQYQASATVQMNLGVGWLDGEARRGIVSGEDQKGQALPNAPDWNINAAVSWDFLQTDVGVATLRFDAVHVGAQYFTLPHTPRVQADSYTISNARLGFNASDASWRIGLWIRNIGDELYTTSMVALDGLAGYDYSQIGPPRHFGLDLTYDF